MSSLSIDRSNGPTDLIDYFESEKGGPLFSGDVPFEISAYRSRECIGGWPAMVPLHRRRGFRSLPVSQVERATERPDPSWTATLMTRKRHPQFY